MGGGGRMQRMRSPVNENVESHDPVRVEVNLGLPLVAAKGDGTRKGLQVGIGLDFL